jgi:hypothetical protein
MSWRTLPPATILSALLTTSVALTISQPLEHLVTIASHYPVFLLIAWTVVQAVPRKWWTVLYACAIPLLLIELLAFGMQSVATRVCASDHVQPTTIAAQHALTTELGKTPYTWHPIF